MVLHSLRVFQNFREVNRFQGGASEDSGAFAHSYLR